MTKTPRTPDGEKKKFDPRSPDRPNPRKPPQRTTLWLDLATGAGLDDAGRDVLPLIGGRRKTPILVDLLNAALHHHADRVIICGDLPDDPSSWLQPSKGRTMEQFLPDWEQKSIHLGQNPAGRFTHTETGHKVKVVTAAEWFKTPADITTKQARWAHKALTEVVAEVSDRQWELLDHPGATGINLWRRYAPASYDMARMDRDLGKLILGTDPQHRFEQFVEGPGRCDCGDCPHLIAAGTELPCFTYCDGRFMYGGAVKRELGAAPAEFLPTDQAAALFASNPYWPARYYAKFTVPEGWAHMGLLAVKRPAGGWHWPNRPSAVHETWADTEELHFAAQHGWTIEILEGIKLSKVDSLSPFADAINKMVDAADTKWAANPTAASVITGALKHMYRVTIGQFAARPPLTTAVVASAEEIPEDIASFHPNRDSSGEVTSYTYAADEDFGDPDSWHPEIAARVWALSRLRVLSTPTALKTEDGKVLKQGAITVPADELIGLQGDAIYTTNTPLWTFPTSEGGGDDGRPGRIRIKGHLPDPVTAPVTREERQELSNRAEQWWGDE